MIKFKKIFLKIKLLTLLLFFFFITGCGTSFEGKDITFDHYSVQIGNKFEEKNISIFENKRTKGHIFKAFVFPYDGELVGEVFEKNIIFAAIKNIQNVDSKLFANIAKTSIMKIFPGYRQVSFFNKKISCKNFDDINLYIHSFGYTQYNNMSGGYWTTQAYFADKDFLYTLSASSDVESDIDVFEQYFQTLKCNTK